MSQDENNGERKKEKRRNSYLKPMNAASDTQHVNERRNVMKKMA